MASNARCPRAPVALHALLAVVELRDVGVVLAAHEAHVVGIVRAAAAVGIAVVKLEAAALGATTTVPQEKRALVAVTLADTASHGRGEMARAR